MSGFVFGFLVGFFFGSVALKIVIWLDYRSDKAKFRKELREFHESRKRQESLNKGDAPPK